MVAEMSTQLPTGSAKMTSGEKAAKLFGSLQQIGEAAAKATAGNLARVDAAGLGKASVHQTAVLIVRDHGRAQAAPAKNLRGPQDESGLPRAKEAADQNQNRDVIRFHSIGCGRETAC
jgi:hypothetical protein